jgi:hydroxyacylglutathione hydrolase
VLHKIGVEEIAGAFDVEEVKRSGLASETYSSGTPDDLVDSIQKHRVSLIDVRSDVEWEVGHIEQATHMFLGQLPSFLERLPRDEKIVVQCQGGARSAIGVSVLQAAGFKDVVNLSGGFNAWKAAGLPSVVSEPALSERA